MQKLEDVEWVILSSSFTLLLFIHNAEVVARAKGQGKSLREQGGPGRTIVFFLTRMKLYFSGLGS